MTDSKNESKQLVKEIEEKIEFQKTMKIVKLSKRSLPVTFVLCLLIPIAAYIYTQRWTPLFLFLLAVTAFSVTVAASGNISYVEELVIITSIFASVISLIDNTIAINRARYYIR
jgi:hypothetical protein